MPREFPRFLYSNPFVVHLFFPRFICREINDVEEVRSKETYYIHQSGRTLELLEVFEPTVNDAISIKVSDAMYDMLAWLPSQQQ